PGSPPPPPRISAAPAARSAARRPSPRSREPSTGRRRRTARPGPGRGRSRAAPPPPGPAGPPRPRTGAAPCPIPPARVGRRASAASAAWTARGERPHCAVVGTQGTQAREARVDDPQLVAGPGQLVDADVPGHVAGARQVAGVVQAGRLDPRGEVRGVAEG